MALNEKKIIDVILSNLKDINPRYNDYQKDLTELVVDIITAERLHQTQKQSIIQDISDKINTVGMELFRETEE